MQGLQRGRRIPGVGARVARDVRHAARRAAVVLPQPATDELAPVVVRDAVGPSVNKEAVARWEPVLRQAPPFIIPLQLIF